MRFRLSSLRHECLRRPVPNSALSEQLADTGDLGALGVDSLVGVNRVCVVSDLLVHGIGDSVLEGCRQELLPKLPGAPQTCPLRILAVWLELYVGVVLAAEDASDVEKPLKHLEWFRVVRRQSHLTLLALHPPLHQPAAIHENRIEVVRVLDEKIFMNGELTVVARSADVEGDGALAKSALCQHCYKVVT